MINIIINHVQIILTIIIMIVFDNYHHQVGQMWMTSWYIPKAPKTSCTDGIIIVVVVFKIMIVMVMMMVMMMVMVMIPSAARMPADQKTSPQRAGRKRRPPIREPYWS